MASRKSPLWVPERAEIIFIQYSPHVGEEMPNDHPMLVVSTKAFAERTGIVMGFPMTHSESHANNPFAITAPGAKGERGLPSDPSTEVLRLASVQCTPSSLGHRAYEAAGLSAEAI